ncbi:hypothetical protein NCCP133_38060 [Cytobacillus sp. NCCP-133]|nr:hypothetical protein NCCP133_38060 [Cytobacillus sp. NCCP-133]
MGEEGRLAEKDMLFFTGEKCYKTETQKRLESKRFCYAILILLPPHYKASPAELFLAVGSDFHLSFFSQADISKTVIFRVFPADDHSFFLELFKA